jgi:hypothetical protein
MCLVQESLEPGTRYGRSKRKDIRWGRDGGRKKKLTQEMAMETAKRRVRGGVFGDFSLAFSRI